MNDIRFIDLFSGVDGFRVGLERAGPFRSVWSCDNSKYANQIHYRNYGKEDHHPGDIREIDAGGLPDFDLLCAGFPCQAFSVAGKRKGFEDTRGTLFFEICRIAEVKRPPLLLLENVKGLLSHQRGETFHTILQSLEALGYWVEWQVLNSKYFGAPQNRERVFIVGHLGGSGGREIFPLSGSHGEPAKKLEKIGNIAKSGHDSLWGRVYDPGGISMNLNARGGGMGAKTGLYAIPVLTPDRAKKRQNGRRFKTPGEPSFTLTGQDIHGVAISFTNPHNASEERIPHTSRTSRAVKPPYGNQNPLALDGMRIRRLTPTECERLQGFPDGWTEFGYEEGAVLDWEPIYGWDTTLDEGGEIAFSEDGEVDVVWKVIDRKPIEPMEDTVLISDSQRYRCLGNAVTTNVVQFLGTKIAEMLAGEVSPN